MDDKWMDGRTEECLYYITVSLLCCIDIYMTHVYRYMLLIHVLQASSIRCYVFIYFFYIYFFYFGHKSLL